MCAAAVSPLARIFKSRISTPIELFQPPNQRKKFPRAAADPVYWSGGYNVEINNVGRIK
jgi:hypothetical protein